MKLRHVVLFGFGKAQSPAAIAEVVRRFVELRALVPGIDDFEWGENSSPEGLDHGHSHVFLLPCASGSRGPCELGPAICVVGDGSGLLGRKDAKLSLGTRVTI
jgi:Stress responsive A/B Barrel Domain